MKQGKQRVVPTAFHGITLIELLVGMLIVGLLSAVALPGYGAVMQRVHRGDARVALLRLQHLQERHYAMHLRYAAQLGTLADGETLVHTSRSDAGYYDLMVTATRNGQGFVAQAAARADGRQHADRQCRVLTVDETGGRRSADDAGSWLESSAGRCWG